MRVPVIPGIGNHGQLLCGEGEIRTPATLSGRPVFETGAFNHSATSPGGGRQANGLLQNRQIARDIWDVSVPLGFSQTSLPILRLLNRLDDSPSQLLSRRLTRYTTGVLQLGTDELGKDQRSAEGTEDSCA
jgi:hypothetical protein